MIKWDENLLKKLARKLAPSPCYVMPSVVVRGKQELQKTISGVACSLRFLISMIVVG